MGTACQRSSIPHPTHPAGGARTATGQTPPPLHTRTRCAIVGLRSMREGTPCHAMVPLVRASDRATIVAHILQTDAKKDCYERVSDSLHAAMQRGVRRRNSPLTHRPSHGLSCKTSSACIARETRKATQKAAAVALSCSGDVEVVDRKLAATQSAREARHTVVRGAQHVSLTERRLGRHALRQPWRQQHSRRWRPPER